MKYDFSNNEIWAKLAPEIVKHIPTIASGTGNYNAWLKVIWNIKQAEMEKEFADVWSGEEEIEEAKWDSLPIEKTPAEARAELYNMAKKNGYILPDYQIKFVESYDADLTQKLLDKMYAPEDVICWTLPRWDEKQKKFIPDGGKIRFTARSRFTPEFIEHLFLVENHGCYIQLNKVDEKALEAYKEKEGNAKSVKDEHVISYKYHFIEMDEYSIEEQKQILNKINLPWIGIVHSGNKSLHVYINIDASNLVEWKARVKKIHQYLDNQGVKYDASNKNINKFCRGFFSKRLGKDETNGEKAQFVVAVNDCPLSFETWDKSVNATNDVEYKFFVEKFDKDGNVKGCEVSEAEIYRWLTDQGFVSAEFDKKIVNAKINGNLVTRLNWDVILSELSEYIKSNYSDKINVWLKHGKSYTENFFRLLKKVNITIHNDTNNSVFLYFKNGFLEVSQCGTKLHSWDEFQGYIWDDAFRSLGRDFCKNDEKSQFEIFIEKITSTEKRKKILMSIFGYYLSRDKNRHNAKCLYLTDRETDLELKSSKGGTGKDTFFLAVSQFRKMLFIDCKKPEMNSRFGLSGMTDGVNFIVYSDLKEYYDPKTLFNQITGDLEFEKKGENVKTIPFELSPKIGITANFVVKDLINDSSKRRFVPFELDKFFSAKNTIFDFFGNDFFCKDWDEKEWSRFDTFAVRCIQLFLNEGVLEENSETFEIKAILENCGHLKNFAEEYIIPKLSTQTFFANEEIAANYVEFIKKNPGTKPFGPNNRKEILKLLFAPGFKSERTNAKRGFNIDVANWKCRPYYESIEDFELPVKSVKQDEVSNVNEEKKTQTNYEDEFSFSSVTKDEIENDTTGFFSSAPTAVKKTYIYLNRRKPYRTKLAGRDGWFRPNPYVKGSFIPVSEDGLTSLDPRYEIRPNYKDEYEDEK